MIFGAAPGVLPRERDERRVDEALHLASYLSMASVRFVVAFTLARDGTRARLRC